ncbi:MAG TPA: ATP-binding protein [Candidatus Rifleibacterium sp.]|nr:ATP-binding protein [Candidatus Rifleibacterium sp.]HPT47948.1 ATP-binding protein [Candidatus Rifleibacterium sp.]
MKNIYISLRFKFIVLLFMLIASLALVINETSTALIHEKTREIFQQRLDLLRESIKSYWESEKNMLLNNALLYAESEKIMNYSSYGLNNLLQKEIERLIAKTGFSDLRVVLRNGTVISSDHPEASRVAPLEMRDSNQHLARVEVQYHEDGLYLSAEVPVLKLGDLIGRLSLRRRLDDTRMKRTARNLQAATAVAVKETLVASSLSDSDRQELAKEHLRNSLRKEDLFNIKFGKTTWSIGRENIAKTADGDQVTIYLGVSQEKMLSLIEDARARNLSATGWILVAALIISIFFTEKVLLSRIRQIRDGANIVAGGDLGFQIEAEQGDELGNLARSFNRMATSLKLNRDHLQHHVEHIEKLANYIQNILGSLKTCVITWTLSGHIETANQAAVQEFSDLFSSLEGLSLKHFLKKLPKASRREILNGWRRVREPGERQFEIEIDGGGSSGLKVLQGTFSPLLDNERHPYGLILTLSNITQRKIIEQQLYHADKLSSIGQMAASIAHEIKNPLASIKTLGQLLQEETARDDSRSEYIEVIVSEVNRLNSVVEQLLKYAKPEGSSFGEVEFAEIINPVLALVHHESERRRISLQADYPDNMKVFVDSEKLKQVFLNLIFNAVQAMTDGGQIIIRASRETDSPWATFEVQDSGAGMPQETVARIFEPFFTTKQRGTGLGLAIVKKIVDLHGGKIEVSSEPGKGTRFKIYLPVKQEG